MESNVLKYVEINPEAKPLATLIWLHGLGVDGHDFVPIVPELRIPDTLPLDLVAICRDTLSALWPVFVVLLSVSMTFYVLRRVYGLIPKR